MSSYTRHRFPLYQVQCRIKLYIAFRCTRYNVELHSTSLSTVPGPMSKLHSISLSVVPGPKSSYTRHRFPLYHVQCRVHSTSLSAVPGPMSKLHSTSNFRCTRSNVELQSTSLSVVPGTMSSYTRQRFPLHQVQCRVTLDIGFSCTRFNVELHSA
jgi:hypothetical protein